MENSEEKIRYLEMIQQIVTRMASNSFMLKGWGVTLVAGIFALSAKDSNLLFFLVTYIPIVVFWCLDSYYLQLERKYRVLYNMALQCTNQKVSFNLVIPDSDDKNKTAFIQCLLSISEIGYYLPLALLVAIVMILTSTL